MKSDAPTVLFSILSLFFIQQVTFLVESIYMLNLLNTSLDARALGVLFFYSPIFLIFAQRNVRNRYILFWGFLFFAASIMTPWGSTSTRILSAGIAVASFLIFLGLFFTKRQARNVNWIFSFAVALLFSLLFRVLGSTLDISVTGKTKFIGMILGLAAAFLLVMTMRERMDSQDITKQDDQNSARTWAATMGFMSCLVLLYFAFAAPTVLTRWTESGYVHAHIFYIGSLFILLSVTILFPNILKRLTLRSIFVWNMLFLVCLIFTIVRHMIVFPSTPDSASVVVDAAVGSFDIPTILTLVLAPVIILDLYIFLKNMSVTRPSQLALPLGCAGLFFSVLIFMLIFTNVWGYVEPVSRLFRNKFFLPFLFAGLGMLVPLLVFRQFVFDPIQASAKKLKMIVLSIVSVVALIFVVKVESRRVSVQADRSNLSIMSYNIQQGVDDAGNKNYQKQLELIQRVDPDILCLQESDVARLSGGNSDVVRYFAQKLSYFSYYGPKTVTGTFGTAILSRFPLENCRTIFSYSDVDEIGTAAGEIFVAGKRVSIFNSHPAGGPDAKSAHVEALVDMFEENQYIIAAGDYNFRQNSQYYKQITTFLRDSWLSCWPDGIGDMRMAGITRGDFDVRFADGIWIDDGLLRMDDRIDHIFLSDKFEVLTSVYVPAPESQSDHPAHWAIVKIVE